MDRVTLATYEINGRQVQVDGLRTRRQLLGRYKLYELWLLRPDSLLDLCLTEGVEPLYPKKDGGVTATELPSRDAIVTWLGFVYPPTDEIWSH